MTDPLTAPTTDASSRYGLPFLMPGQGQKEFFINEALMRCDVMLHGTVEGALAAPPGNPPEGACWIVAAGAGGAWTGRDDTVAAWQSGAWRYVEPRAGMRMFDGSTAQFIHYRDGWQRPAAPAEASGGAIIDAELRAAFTDLVARLRAAGVLSA